MIKFLSKKYQLKGYFYIEWELIDGSKYIQKFNTKEEMEMEIEKNEMLLEAFENELIEHF